MPPPNPTPLRVVPPDEAEPDPFPQGSPYNPYRTLAEMRDIQSIRQDVEVIRSNVATLRSVQQHHGQMLAEHGRDIKDIKDLLGLILERRPPKVNP